MSHTQINIHRIKSVTVVEKTITPDINPPFQTADYIFTDVDGNETKITAFLSMEDRCPRCTDVTRQRHHEGTHAYPECAVRWCETCGWEGDPE